MEKLVEIDSSFGTLSRRFIELPIKRPEEKIKFGTAGARYDFLIATMAFYGVAMKWVAVQIGVKNAAQPVIPADAERRR